MPKKEGKYPCQYCGKPCQNPQARSMHEKACPQNPDKASKTEVEKEEIEVKNSPSEEITEKKESQPSPEAAEKLSKEDEFLKQYPIIRRLIEENEIMKRSLLDIDAQGKAIGELTLKMNAVLDNIDKIAQLAAQSPETASLPPEEKPKRTPPVDIDGALKASYEADKENKLGVDPSLTAGKMDELRKEAGGEETKQPVGKDGSGVEQDSALAGVGQPGMMPEGMQKVMAYATMAKEFLPLLQALKGQPIEQAQTPDDMKALDRTFANMSQLFTLALKMTDNVTREARKRVIDEITSTYSLVPKPGSGITIQKPISEESQGEGSTEEAE